ncbi:MAG: sulfite exporter TauE/SafE family protein [Deltaproteobacteria bacterium]|nr:sulfite exporter TauE/SafE family protein [Deltaproteobacteria bacterium]
MVGFLAILAAGTATLATPCVLPLVPVYLALLLGGSLDDARDPAHRRRLVAMTASFVAGFTSVFALLGLGASLAGGLLAAHRSTLALAGGVLVVLLGLFTVGAVQPGLLMRDVRLHGPARVRGAGQGFVLGAVFGLGWTPCAGPVLATVLTYAAGASDGWRGAALLATYGLGLGLPLLLVALTVEKSLPWLRRAMPAMVPLQRAGGALMIAFGVWTAVGAWESADGGARVAVDTAGTTLDPVYGAALPRPRLLELVEPGCPVCARQAAEVEALRRDCTDHAVDIHTVDLAHPGNAPLRAALGVVAVPTFVLLDDGGRVVATLVGERTRDELRGLAAHLQQVACEGVAPADPAAFSDGERCTGGAAGGSCG